MQLKIRRSQSEGGVISKTAIFCLDASHQAERKPAFIYVDEAGSFFNSNIVILSGVPQTPLVRIGSPSHARQGSGLIGAFRAKFWICWISVNHL